MTHPVVERILSGQVPANVKQAAAKGALPIPREDLIELWVLLRADADSSIRLACNESLAGVSELEWGELLPSHGFAPQVLDFAVRVLGKNHRILQAALRNPKVPVPAVEWIAAQTSDWGIDMVLDNQSRLIKSPQIAVALLSNPNLNPTQVRQIFDLAEQFFKEDPQIPEILAQKFGLRLGHAGGELYKEEAEEAPAPVEVAPEAIEEELPVEGLIEEELTPDKFQNLYQRLLTMSVPAKIQLALKGNKEARTLLIKDNNKVIQEAVLDSPKLTDTEVELFTKMRNLPEDIFRKISRDHEFMKKYSIARGLVFNPKVPPGISLSLMQRILDADLQILMKDKNVTELVRRQAKTLYEMRHQTKKSIFKKH